MERRLPGDAKTQFIKEEIIKEERPIIPAVLLERRVISMLNPPPNGRTLASTTTTVTDASQTTTTTTIVGEKGPLEEKASSLVAATTSTTSTTAVGRSSSSHQAEEYQKEGQQISPEVQEQLQLQPEQIQRETKYDDRQEKKQLETKEITQEKLPNGTREIPERAKEVEENIQSFMEEILQTEQKASSVKEQVHLVKEETLPVSRFTGEAASRPSTLPTQQPSEQDKADAIEFFEEQDPNLSMTKSSLLLPPPAHGPGHHKGQRSPSPSSSPHASVGLSHLDNLIKLMEQLSTLRDENVKLRKKCDYLETTKNLLQARSEMLAVSDTHHAPGHATIPGKHRHKMHKSHHESEPKSATSLTRPRLASAEDVQSMEISGSSSEHRPKRPMHKRSFSTGSLEVEILDETGEGGGSDALLTKSKSGKSVFSSKSSKQKSKSSKWARVKKVLTGQKLYEDLGTTIRSLGRSTQRYSSVSSGHDISPPSQRAVDTSVSTSLDAESAARAMQASTSSAETPGSVSRSFIHATSADLEELSSEIWMGPPGWWEQYEASRKRSETSSTSDVSSVIEVKTMYLGSKQKDSEHLLRVKPLTRRQSSPSLCTKETEGRVREEIEEREEANQVHRSVSYKGGEFDLPKEVSLGTSPPAKNERDSKKLHRTPWGRVKEMIHVRKDSVKKRSRRDRAERADSCEWSQGEEVSEGDIEGLMEEHLSGEFAENVMGRSTPKTSPMIMPRQSSSKSFSESPPGVSQAPSIPGRMAVSAGSAEMAALLAGSMSEEFTQKMLEWQELQLRKTSSFRATSAEAEGNGTSVDGHPGDSQEPVPSSPPRETERSKFKRTSPSQQRLEGPTEQESLPELTTLDLLGPSVNVEELQRRISESFSRKLAEWERLKYRRPTTPEMERKGSRGKKEKGEERSRSKKSREEKERERQEKAREREMQKMEKEQVKLEKEKIRIEKERQRALERQAKLERMKGRLNQLEPEPSTPAPPLSPLSSPGPATQQPQYNVPADFARKLQEWESKKGTTLMSAEAGAAQQPLQPVPRQPAERRGPVRPPPLSLQPCIDSPEDRSPVERTSDVSVGDDNTSITDESITSSNILSLEKANSHLLEEVQRKEKEYATLQDEVYRLNSKLEKVRQEHASEMLRFKRDLEAGRIGQPVQVEVGELESTVRELEEKIALMENAGDQLAESMESAAIGKWQSIEGEEMVNQQLVEMVDQMKVMLQEAAQTSESFESSLQPSLHEPGSEEQTQKTLALHNFEKVYSHAMKLQVQMNNLRVSQLERNKEIMYIKRQLLLQEVNNVLLQAHITQRETELLQYKEARKVGMLKRWNTFSTSDTPRPPRAQGLDARPPLQRIVSLQEGDQPIKQQQPLPSPTKYASNGHDDIPLITDDISIPETRIGPVIKINVDDDTATGLQWPDSEQSTDHLEHHLAHITSDTAKIPTPAETQRAQARTTPGLPTGVTLGQEGHPPESVSYPSTDVTRIPPLGGPFKVGEEGTRTESLASEVETGSPTLLARRKLETLRSGLIRPNLPLAEIPQALIPERPASSQADTLSLGAKVAPQDDTYSLTKSVIGCTEHAVGTTLPTPGEPSASGGVDITSREQQTKVVRSPISKQKYLRRQREESEKHKKRAASPKSGQDPRVDLSGKPPLPRPSTSYSPAITLRSKSVSDMDGVTPDSVKAETPLRDVIQRFEKRATVCETEERKIEYRKTPSPTLHLPRVGLVSRVRRLKPAAELLLESQRYRSGNTIYATRIMHRFLPAQASKSPLAGAATAAVTPSSSQDKENISGTSYVQAIVKRLSREGTPLKSAGSSSTSSSLSLQRTDSPRAHSEFVAHVVRKLSSSSGPEAHRSSSMPFKDRTNEGQVKKMTETFDQEHQQRSPERTLPDSEMGFPDRAGSAGGSLALPTSVSGASTQKPDSTISISGHKSMPALASDQPISSAELTRQRAATYCVSEGEARPRQQEQSEIGVESIEHISEEFLGPEIISRGNGQKISPSSSTKSKSTLCCKSSTCTRSRTETPSSSAAAEAAAGGGRKQPSSPKSQDLRSKREKMETIEVLCKQSMSFDLGVSLRAHSPETAVRRHRGSDGLAEGGASEGAAARLSSTSSEGEVAASEEKKKSRTRFLDASWLQKPKKFFKVSK